MSSITRKLHWYGIRRKIRRSLRIDLLLYILLIFTWCAGGEFAAVGEIVPENPRALNYIESADTGYGFDFVYWVTTPEGKVLLRESCLLPLACMTAGVGALLLLQGLGIFLTYYREDRAIRKILSPINEIALRAEELSRLSFTEEKYQMIEEALAQIQPEQAGTEGPLSFGDSDLSGVEAAMNNLLLRMRDSYRQQSRFVNDASHELRTPIAVIEGYANMLDRWGKTDEQILDESISAIKHEAEHMNYLVEQLLFLARGDSGKTAVHTEIVSVPEFMQEIYEESLMIDEAHRYRLLTPSALPINSGYGSAGGEGSGENPGQDVLSIAIDPGLMKQAVRILIDNAAKYTASGDEIILSYGIDDKNCPYLQIEDTGSGIEASGLPHIFERFYRTDEARESSGTGLGLSIAKWIVDKHDGHFEVLSGMGLGTRIRIVL